MQYELHRVTVKLLKNWLEGFEKEDLQDQEILFSICSKLPEYITDDPPYSQESYIIYSMFSQDNNMRTLLIKEDLTDSTKNRRSPKESDFVDPLYVEQCWRDRQKAINKDNEINKS